MTRRILFLYVTSSGGHQHAADAICSSLKKTHPSFLTFTIDSLVHSYPILGPVFERFYFELIKYTPQIWDYLYDNENIRRVTREIHALFNTISSPSLSGIIKEYTPDCIVCTQALPCSWAAAQKKKGKLPIPLIAIVTDYAVHAYWLYHEVDAYLVAHENLKRFLINQGISARKVHVTGIPINTEFSHLPGKIESLRRLGFNEHQPALMIMGGGHGLGPVFSTIRSLLQIPIPLQIFVITGLNKRLFKELKNKFGKQKKIRVFGYTKQISRIMAAADLLITKPGGLTSSEALAASLPMVIYNPLPGQEQRNTRFLISHGVAEKVNTVDELQESIQELFSHTDTLRKMKSCALALARPDAAMESAKIILDLIQ